jgi:urease accessory protein
MTATLPAPAAADPWRAHLQIHYRPDAGGGTTAHDRHEGPLRVLQRLYPEGPSICHHVLVHPPGGLVGGDTLDVSLTLGPGSHALLTTPGAARFYRSAGPVAVQQVSVRLAEGARLEWLPLETIAYRGCRARNGLRFELAEGAEMMGWDMLALGLPATRQGFEGAGEVWQQLEWPGVWLERGHLAAADRTLRIRPWAWTAAVCWRPCGGPRARRCPQAGATPCSTRPAPALPSMLTSPRAPVSRPWTHGWSSRGCSRIGSSRPSRSGARCASGGVPSAGIWPARRRGCGARDGL